MDVVDIDGGDSDNDDERRGVEAPYDFFKGPHEADTPLRWWDRLRLLEKPKKFLYMSTAITTLCSFIGIILMCTLLSVNKSGLAIATLLLIVTCMAASMGQIVFYFKREIIIGI